MLAARACSHQSAGTHCSNICAPWYGVLPLVSGEVHQHHHYMVHAYLCVGPTPLLAHAPYCRAMANLPDPPSCVKDLSGKRQLLVLAGQTVTKNAANAQLLHELCKKQHIEVWLPQGSDLGSGDSCFGSPYNHFGDSNSGNI